MTDNENQEHEYHDGAEFYFDGSYFSISSMLSANAHDDECCEFLRSAEIGERFNGCERVS